MYTAKLTFAERELDPAFHALDQVISQIAKSVPGYQGEESGENTAAGIVCNVYYWDNLEALQQLIDHQAHRAAKQQQGKWPSGYQFLISQVLKSYGDGGIGHRSRRQEVASTRARRCCSQDRERAQMHARHRSLDDGLV